MRHVVDFSNFHQCPKTHLFVSENQIEEASNEIHALTVFYLWVVERVCFEDVLQDLRLYNVFIVVERSLNIHGYQFTHLLFECLLFINGILLFNHRVFLIL